MGWDSVSAGMIDIGIGLATAKVQAGFFDSRRRKEYTVMGMPVIVAARLENLAGRNQILVCEETFQAIRHRVSARQAATSVLRGMTKPVSVYEVLEIL